MRRRIVSEWLGLDMAAARAGVSRRTLHRWVKAGRLRARREGTRTFVHSDDLSPAGRSMSLLDLFVPLRDETLAREVMHAYRDRRREGVRPVPRLP